MEKLTTEWKFFNLIKTAQLGGAFLISNKSMFTATSSNNLQTPTH